MPTQIVALRNDLSTARDRIFMPCASIRSLPISGLRGAVGDIPSSRARPRLFVRI